MFWVMNHYRNTRIGFSSAKVIFSHKNGMMMDLTSGVHNPEGAGAGEGASGVRGDTDGETLVCYKTGVN